VIDVQSHQNSDDVPSMALLLVRAARSWAVRTKWMRKTTSWRWITGFSPEHRLGQIDGSTSKCSRSPYASASATCRKTSFCTAIFGLSLLTFCAEVKGIRRGYGEPDR